MSRSHVTKLMTRRLIFIVNSFKQLRIVSTLLFSLLLSIGEYRAHLRQMEKDRRQRQEARLLYRKRLTITIVVIDYCGNTKRVTVTIRIYRRAWCDHVVARHSRQTI